MTTLRAHWLVLIQLLLCCSVFVAFASPHSPLDDTQGMVDLQPDTSLVLPWTTISITAGLTLTDGRVFDLQFAYDPDRLEFLSAVANTDPSLHLMSPLVSSGVLTLDGFFHPNFSGTMALVTLSFYVKPVAADDTTMVSFLGGQGYSGTEDNPVPIQFSGNTAVIFIEGTLPVAPSTLLISPLSPPAHDDSILVRWHRVFWDADGDTLINPLYIVYREDVLHTPGIYDSIGATPDTFFYDDMNVTVQPDDTSAAIICTIRVHARKTQP